MSRISEILYTYDTDKVRRPLTTQINGKDVTSEVGHSYGDFYDEVFEQFGDAIDLLEIGVYWGGSLLAWKEFLPKSNIYGLDIVDIRKPEYISDDVHFILSDVKNTKAVEGKMFDIIIDDGSHFLDDVVFVVNNYLSLLKPKGMLIVEDVQDGQSWTIRLQGIVPEGYKLEVRDLRPTGGYDDFLITIQKV